MRRSRMPVRVVIHSSVVSTIDSKSAFVTIRSGTAIPVDRKTAPFPFSIGTLPRRPGVAIRAGGVVTPWSLLGGVENLPARVVPAMGAHPVRQLRLEAAIALHDPGGRRLLV